ncbi:MAG: TfoX/Sxy family protein [Anaerolineae bacterium]
MAFAKSSPEVVERFTNALPKHPDAQSRKMFGYAACFVNGNFFTGMYEDNIVIRLPGGLKDKFPELARAPGFNPMGQGKGMKDWWVIPDDIVADAGKLRDILAATFIEVHQLPPKEPKKKSSTPRKKKQT